ncbi:hypothetical protein [Cereibacter sphaeroides]|uniref:hypothetical protein n=1 Tax=Cereibacter sphaeroides TaxID=1063 RepID=UPI000313F48C|nr:hypothetical protein [Cereibacter sphaeroides]
MTPKHPDIIVTLTGEDGNAFAILGRCRAAARDAGLSDEEIAAFMDEAMAGDYDHLLQTAMRWFEIR